MAKMSFAFVNRYKPLQFQTNKQFEAGNLSFPGHVKRRGGLPVWHMCSMAMPLADGKQHEDNFCTAAKYFRNTHG